MLVEGVTRSLLQSVSLRKHWRTRTPPIQHAPRKTTCSHTMSVGAGLDFVMIHSCSPSKQQV